MKKRILYIVPHRLGRSPGQRFRCEHYLGHLRDAGYQVTYSNLLGPWDDRMFYQRGKYVPKLWIFLKANVVRCLDVVRSFRYSHIFIYREAIMTGSIFYERAMKLGKAKMVFDFDDSIWLKDTSPGNERLSWLKRPGKTADICALSDLVIVGNTYLDSYARSYCNNVAIIPTTIDTDYHRHPTGYTVNHRVCIGWTGSETTLKHFTSITSVLGRIKSMFGSRVYFKLINNAPYFNEELDLAWTPWSVDTEIEELASIDIGIMPLPDDEWSRGKCGFKGLQYMGLGIPTVMSPVGVNTDIITDGVNGYLASTDEEWIEKLSLLVNDGALRVAIGQAGQLTVREKYSIKANKDKYIDLIDSLLDT